MKESISKIVLYLIYAGIAIVLASPLFVDSSFFFPFITTRAFVFRTVVDFMMLGLLMLMAMRPAMRASLGGLTGQFLGLFVLIAFVASLLGANFYNSFWGDMERSEGLLLWLNLLAFFFVIVCVVRSEKAWLRLLDVSLVVALLTALFGLGQWFGLESILNSSGSRVDGTFGNAAFFAAYLIFHVGICALLFIKRKSLRIRSYYVLAAVLLSIVIFATQTRGAVLGLGAGSFVAAILALWSFRGDTLVRRFSIGTLVSVLVLGGFIYFFRNTSVVRNTPVLYRLASISTTTRTAETRLLTWQAAWNGWKGNFLLGVGMENFNIIFNEKFPPKIYEDEGSVVWFDRAHNFIFDRGTTTGILGLLAYLGFILYPPYALWKRAKRDSQLVPFTIAAVGLTLAFLVQNLFVFENITTYPILMFTWAFLTFSSSLPRDQFGITQDHLERKSKGEEGIERSLDSSQPVSQTKVWGWSAAAIVFAVALIPMLWVTTWNPGKINLAAASGIRVRSDGDEAFLTFYEKMRKVIDANTYGNSEYRLNFIEQVSLTLGNKGEVMGAGKPVLEYTESQIDRLLQESPNDAKNYLLAMRFYNDTRGAIPGQEVARLEKALSYYPRLHELSPTRPHVSQEAGYTYRYLMLGYQRTGNPQAAEEARAQAEKYFREALELQPQVVESYINLIRLHLESNQQNRVQEVVSLMQERGVLYRQARHLANLTAISKNTKSLPWIEFFSNELIKVEPDNFNAWIDYALALAYQDKRQEAIEAAERIKEFGGDFVEQADAFIANVNSSYYLQNPLE